jgi:HlyD family secretion protein
MFWQLVTFSLSLLGVCGAVSLINYPPDPIHETNMYAPPPVNPFKEAVAATGLVEAYEENILIGVPVEALVKNVYVQAGDRVKAGDLLLELDDRLAIAQVELQKQNVKVAQATWEKNISQLSRLNAVKDERAVSLEDLRNKEYDVKVADEQIAAAKAALQSAITALELTKITSPKDGVILRSTLRTGEFANFIPIDPVDSLVPALVIGVIDTLQIRADVDEQNAYRVRPGQKAVAYTRGTLLVEFPLTFQRIEPFCIPKRNLSSAANERIDTRVLQVIYTFEPNKDYPVYVGQQVDIFIEAPIAEGNSNSR